MEERELASLIEQEVTQAIGHWDGELAAERKQELDYYYARPFGNEVIGESQVVSTDVFDTIEGMLPGLLKIFTSSDDAVRFEPVGPEDEEAANQQTEVCNYVFYKQNNGFVTLYEWFKDALLQKNGVVKYWWDNTVQKSQETYEGLTEGQYRMLLQDKSVKEIAHTAYEDPISAEQKNALIAQLQASKDPQAIVALPQVSAAPVPQLHDVTVEISKDVSKVCIETVPPEEFGISNKQRCISIQEAPFCYHRTRKTKSELREAGYPEEKIDLLGTDPADRLNPETLARDHFIDQTNISTRTTNDPSLEEVWVFDGFIRVDYDGDGIAELRHFVKAGQEILENEPADHINFAALTPIIMPHRWTGRSAAELVMADQFVKSTLWRQMLNNLYLTNNPRKAVLSTAGGITQANLDDLQNSVPGAIMREYVPGAIRNEEVPFVAGAAFPMLEYIDSAKEVRTGQTRYSQGTDADSLNKTARGIAMIQAAGQQRLELIARIFAETGVKDLFKGIVYMLSKYSSRPIAMKLRNKWVDVDPRQWKTQYDMTINVGLGTGNKDVLLAQLARMSEVQTQLMKEGRGYMVTDENLWNIGKQMSQAMGFKHPEMFIADPTTVQKPPPSPPPEIIKIQADSDEAKMKVASAERQKNAELEHGEKIAMIQAQSNIEIAKINAMKSAELQQMQMRHDAQMAAMKENFDRLKARLDAETTLATAQLTADTSLKTATISAASRSKRAAS